MSLHQFLFLVVAAIFVSGCSNGSSVSVNTDVPPVGDDGGDGGGDDGGDGSGDGGDGSGTGGTDPTISPEDVSGEWFSRIEVNAVNCGLGEFIDAQAFVITQDQADISVIASSGDTFIGTVSGDIVEWSGSYDERGGTTTLTALTLIASGDSVSGDASWTWTDGTDSCNGTMVISAARGTAVVESNMNSRPPGTVDPLILENGVSFITGEVVGVDRDYFAITPVENATVQVQLSHYDTTTDPLSLEVLDSNLNQVASSDNPVGFETINVELVAGETYFIGVVLNASSASPINYILSIDVN